jgi:hypothetical protein
MNFAPSSAATYPDQGRHVPRYEFIFHSLTQGASQNAPGLMNRPILRDLVAATTNGTASWLTPPDVLALGTALALLPQSVEPDLDIAHRKLVKALGTNSGDDVQPAEDLVIRSCLRGERWADNISQPALQIAGQSWQRRDDWPPSSSLMKCQIFLSDLLASLAAHILSLPTPCAPCSEATCGRRGHRGGLPHRKSCDHPGRRSRWVSHRDPVRCWLSFETYVGCFRCCQSYRR